MTVWEAIQDHLGPSLSAGVEGCGFVLEADRGPYLLRSPNLAAETGLAPSNRTLFATPSFELWKRVHEGRQQFLAVVHNHPLNCSADPSLTDLREGAKFSWYRDADGWDRSIPWLIWNGLDRNLWDMNPHHLTSAQVAALPQLQLREILQPQRLDPQRLTWLGAEIEENHS
jgi:hypothetical protein